METKPSVREKRQRERDMQTGYGRTCLQDNTEGAGKSGVQGHPVLRPCLKKMEEKEGGREGKKKGGKLAEERRKTGKEREERTNGEDKNI